MKKIWKYLLIGLAGIGILVLVGFKYAANIGRLFSRNRVADDGGDARHTSADRVRDDITDVGTGLNGIADGADSVRDGLDTITSGAELSVSGVGHISDGIEQLRALIHRLREEGGGSDSTT